MTVACLELPELPLQLAWRREPAIRARPVVVVESDRPQARVLWACERARGAGVLPGMRYSHALGLCNGLMGRIIAEEAIAAAVTELHAVLATLSPRVDLGSATAPGSFWLDGDGLDRLVPRVAWAQTIKRTADKLGYRNVVIVGWSRFATYAVARAHRSEVVVFHADADERAAAAAVPLARLDIDPALRDALVRLGVATVGQLVRLPAGGILERFGGDAHRLYQLAARERWDPIVPTAPPDTPDERVLFDDDETDVERLAFAIKGATARLLDRLAARTRACTALHVELACRATLHASELQAHCIKPAAPTLDGRVLARLVHLRLTGEPPPAPVYELRVWADDVVATREQLALFVDRPRRDLRAADEAIARLRAEFGNDTVVRAVLRDGHLPEASYSWERLDHVVPANPQPREIRSFVRRVLAHPQQLYGRARQVRDDGWLLSGLEQGAVVRIVGPYIVSGGWWSGGDGHELHREYHFAELKRGDCLWVYYDRPRRRWYGHGRLE